MDVSVFSVIFNDFCSVLWVLLYFTQGAAFIETHCIMVWLNIYCINSVKVILSLFLGDFTFLLQWCYA